MAGNSIAGLSIVISGNANPFAREVARTEALANRMYKAVHRPAGDAGGRGILAGAGSALSGASTAGMTAAVTAGTLLAGGLSGVAEAGLKAAQTAVKLAADYQDAAVAFRVMTKDAAVGKKLLDDLYRFAADTPFSSGELVLAGKQLLGFGVPAKEIVPVIGALGDIAAGTGTEFFRLADAFAKVASQGRMQGDELGRFNEAGIGIEEFARAAKMGVGQFRAEMERGRIGADVMIRAINDMTQAGGRFHGMMDEMSLTVRGRWNNLTETVSMGAMRVGLAFFEGFRPGEILTGLSDFAAQTEGTEKRLTAFFGKTRQGFDMVAAAVMAGGSAWADYAGKVTGAVGQIKWDDFATGLDMAIQIALNGFAQLLAAADQFRVEFAENVLKPMAQGLKGLDPTAQPDKGGQSAIQGAAAGGASRAVGQYIADAAVPESVKQAAVAAAAAGRMMETLAEEMAKNPQKMGDAGKKIKEDYLRYKAEMDALSRQVERDRKQRDAIGTWGAKQASPEALSFAQDVAKFRAHATPLAEFERTRRLAEEAKRFQLAPSAEIEDFVAHSFLALEKSFQALETRLPAAMMAKSQEAESVISAALTQSSGRNPNARVEEILRHVREVAQRQEQELKEIRRALAERQAQGWF